MDARVCAADAAVLALHGLLDDEEVLAEAELERAAALERACADTRPLQVLQDGDVLPQAFRRLAHQPHEAGVVVMGAVGEVEAHGVDAGAQERLDALGRRGGRAKGGDNLGGAHTGGVPPFWGGAGRTASGPPDACYRKDGRWGKESRRAHLFEVGFNRALFP